MANNKFYGYNPKKEETVPNEGIPGSGNRLDRVNPYEFRKGMDYELTALGCMRLQESTPEEREKATESVLKNLDHHPAYYSGLMQFEAGMDHGSKIEGKNFKAWLKDHYDMNKMKEVKNAFKFDKMKDADFKNDKMEKLKESIKNEIKQMLKEQEEFDSDEEKADKAAAKGAKKIKSGNRFDLEKEAIENLLYRGKDGKESEFTKDNPAPGSILSKKDELLDLYKSKFKGTEGGNEKYQEEITKANDKFEKVLEKHVKTFGEDGKGNSVTIGDVFGKTLPDTIKALGARLKAIEKEEQEDVVAKTNERYEIAKTDMTREQHIKLLEIIRENGISLKEGAMGVKTYYEIAKATYFEGLSNGLRI